MFEEQARLRYEGRPFLRLLDSLILDIIGQLTEENKKQLEALTPFLQKTWGITGNWQQIITGVIQLPPSFPQAVKSSWQKNSRIARLRGEELSPLQFTYNLVDTNFKGWAARPCPEPDK